MATSAYRLKQDAYACLADDHLIFSDLRSDKYRCLNRTNTQLFLRLLPDFQAGTPAIVDQARVDDAQTQRIVRALTDKGLIANGATVGREFAPIRIPFPTYSLLSSGAGPLLTLQFGHRAAFLQASLKASCKLRLQSLRQTVRGVQHRAGQLRRSNSNDREVICTLVTIFHHLRPYYAREYLCRFDSLALVEFLAHYHQSPRWIFGVKGEPFSAHCWVQDEECLLNDSLDYIRQFTPIMAF